MYYVENFGAWIMDTRRGFVFGVLITVLFAWVLWKTMIGSVTVLTAREFECALTIPDGLGAKCVEYHARKK